MGGGKRMTDSALINILLVDDHAMVREGLATFLETFPDLNLIGAARNGHEAIAFCQHTQPDVILMDLMMPIMDGVSTIEVIHREHPGIRIIALTSFVEDSLVKRALQAGAISYILKDVSASDLAKAIRAAYQGKPTLSPEATEALIHATMTPPPVDYALTEREQDVLALLVKGLENQDIAERLSIAPNTVKNHLATIFSKLGVSNRTEAALLAVRHGLVKVD